MSAHLIIPTIDHELIPYAQNIEAFESLGTKINISNPEVIKIIRNKKFTTDLLSEKNIPTPKTLLIKDFVDARPKGDWILKPSDGSSSIGVIHLKGKSNTSSLIE